MQNILSSLKEILEEENLTYQELLGSSKEKKRILLESRKPDELATLVAREEELVEELRKKEEGRVELLGELALKWQVKEGDLNLDKVVELAPIDFKGEFERIREELKGSIGQIQRINRTNTRLIRASLVTINHILRSVLREEKNSVYQKKGEWQKGGKAFLLDRKV
ncbi:flagellar protein FlgN [bacterium]|nr:flagellar protein FlgN [bacterium]MBU1614224.1 flagellar protein FlgN [bacterium]